MIKKIINELASDSISVSQALAKSKVIIRKLQNENFKNWVNYELIGYPNDNEDNIPDYRKITVDVKGELVNNFGSHSEININMDFLSDYVGEDLNIHHEKTSIEAIEDLLSMPKDDYVQSPLSREMVKILNASVKQSGVKLIKAYREYHVNNLKHILFQVKQKLLDTLINLSEEFPALEEHFNDSKENNSKVQNIINYNVYGGNPTSNFGIGEKVIQKDFGFSREAENLIRKLSELEIPKKEINEVSHIIQNTPKEETGKKLINWLGKFSSKMIEKGIEYKIPQLIDAINNFIEKA